MRTWFAFLVICVAFSGYAIAQSPVEIADGRNDEPYADLSAWAANLPLQQASEAARAYWRGQDAAYEEDYRVFAVADGAFTQPGTEQQAVLFLMSLWPRCCPKMGLAIVEDGRLVRNVAFVGIAQELSAVPDLDGDGYDELVFIGTFGMGGQVSRSMTLVAFGADSLVERGGASIYDSSCASGSGDSGSTAARVLALPGPEYRVERYKAPCDAATWQALSDQEPFELDGPPGTSYVELPIP